MRCVQLTCSFCKKDIFLLPIIVINCCKKYQTEPYCYDCCWYNIANFREEFILRKFAISLEKKNSFKIWNIFNTCIVNLNAKNRMSSIKTFQTFICWTTKLLFRSNLFSVLFSYKKTFQNFLSGYYFLKYEAELVPIVFKMKLWF